MVEWEWKECKECSEHFCEQGEYEQAIHGCKRARCSGFLTSAQCELSGTTIGSNGDIATKDSEVFE